MEDEQLSLLPKPDIQPESQQPTGPDSRADSPSDSLDKKFFEALEKPQSITFQYIVVASILCGFISATPLTQHLSFLLKEPDYDCIIAGVFTEECTADQICQGMNSPQINYMVDMEDQSSLYNWYKQMDLICMPKEKLNYVSVALFSGWTISSLILPPLADSGGREIVILTSNLVLILTSVGILLSNQINYLIVLIFLYGCCIPGQITVGYVYAMEFLNVKQRRNANLLFWTCTGALYMFTSLYYRYIDKHYFYIVSAQMSLAFVPLIGMITFLPESPLWLLKTNQVELFNEELKNLVKFNGQEEQPVFLITQKDKKELDAFEEQGWNVYFNAENAQRELWLNLLAFSLAWSSAFFSTYVMFAYVPFMVGNFYTNTLVIGLARIMGGIAAVFLHSTVNTTLSLVTMFGLSSLGGLLILVAGGASNGAFIVFVFIAKFGLTGACVVCYIGTSEAFPVPVRATAMGTCNFIARLFTVFAVSCAQAADPITPIIVVTVLSAFGAGIAFLIKEPPRQQESPAPIKSDPFE